MEYAVKAVDLAPTDPNTVALYEELCKHVEPPSVKKTEPKPADSGVKNAPNRRAQDLDASANAAVKIKEKTPPPSQPATTAS
jgi:hypothetical protein